MTDTPIQRWDANITKDESGGWCRSEDVAWLEHKCDLVTKAVGAEILARCAIDDWLSRNYAVILHDGTGVERLMKKPAPALAIRETVLQTECVALGKELARGETYTELLDALALHIQEKTE